MREGDEWAISGHKHYTTNGTGWDGNGAHLFTVICRTDPNKPPQESLAVIAVPGNSEGIHITAMIDTLGHRAVSCLASTSKRCASRLRTLSADPAMEPRLSRARSRGPRR